MKFQLGLFDQACVNDPSQPCVNANVPPTRPSPPVATRP